MYITSPKSCGKNNVNPKQKHPSPFSGTKTFTWPHGTCCNCRDRCKNCVSSRSSSEELSEHDWSAQATSGRMAKSRHMDIDMDRNVGSVEGISSFGCGWKLHFRLVLVHYWKQMPRLFFCKIKQPIYIYIIYSIYLYSVYIYIYRVYTQLWQNNSFWRQSVPSTGGGARINAHF